MAVVLTQKQIELIARRAQWYVTVTWLRQPGDPVTFTGMGVNDLDRLISRVTVPAYDPVQITCDVGDLFSSFVVITIDDLSAIRQKYVDIYGNVSKPGVSEDKLKGTAAPNPDENPGLAAPNPPGLQLHGDYQDYGDGRSNMVPLRPADQTPL